MAPGTNVDELVTALHDKSSKVRRSAAETLGELEDARVVEPLTRALTDSDADVRLRIALALGMIGDASATASLNHALKDEQDEAVRGAIEIALDMIKKKVMGKKMRPF